jgi:hypothetical protein
MLRDQKPPGSLYAARPRTQRGPPFQPHGAQRTRPASWPPGNAATRLAAARRPFDFRSARMGIPARTTPGFYFLCGAKGRRLKGPKAPAPPPPRRRNGIHTLSTLLTSGCTASTSRLGAGGWNSPAPPLPPTCPPPHPSCPSLHPMPPALPPASGPRRGRAPSRPHSLPPPPWHACQLRGGGQLRGHEQGGMVRTREKAVSKRGGGGGPPRPRGPL